MKNTARFLSKKEACGLLELIDSSLHCTSFEDFKALISRFKQFVPLDMMGAYLQNKKGKQDGAESPDMVNGDNPFAWMKFCLSDDDQQAAVALDEYFKRAKAYFSADTPQKHSSSGRPLTYAQEFRLNQGHMHETLTLLADKGGAFSLTVDSAEQEERAAAILSLVVPHLHQAFCRVLQHARPGKRPALTRREKEVLGWLKQGKTTWEISVILHLSQRTVHFHVQNLMKKLNASSRVHAVALALEEDTHYPA